MDLNQYAAEIHKTAVEKGWYNKERPIPEVLMLMVSELAEALEEYRNKKPDVYYVIETVQRDGITVIPEIRTDYHDGNYDGEKPEGVAVEMADCLIRILDTMAYMGVDIDDVVLRKMAYNEKRPFRHGGKVC